tara:strand:- start:640 stop:927 length:288 start_codon:yes stop_codon:yes gene_type:complete
MSTGDYDDVIADNLKNIETELSNLTENQKVRLDRRFKDLNIGVIGINNQLNNINKNLELLVKILALKTDKITQNSAEILKISNEEIKNFLEILRK